MGIWKDKAKGYWRYSFKHHNQRYTGSGYNTKAEARSAREQHRLEILHQKPETPTTDTVFSTVANAYLDWSQKRHMKRTYDFKRSILRKFIAFHGDLDIREITPQHLHLYLNTRPNNTNYNSHRQDLCAMFSFAVKQLQVITVSPCWSLEKMPTKPFRKAIPSFEQMSRILIAADKWERQLITILLNTLARVGEIMQLSWQDVNFEHRIITLSTRKRRGSNLETRQIGINDDLYPILWSLWTGRTQDQWVFYNAKTGTHRKRPQKLMEELCQRADVPHYGFHTIRHFASSYLHDKAKIPTGVIGTILGHTNRRTTEIYLHSIDSASIEAMKHLEGLTTNLQDIGFIQTAWPKKEQEQ